jgi:hypothetical protein
MERVGEEQWLERSGSNDVRTRLVRTMRTLAAMLVATAVSAVGAHAAAQPSVRVQFRLPSGNIGCVGSVAMKGLPSFLRCDILSGLRPEPKRPCPLDWTGFSLMSTGAARATCAGDTAYDPRAPILRYGTTWKQGGLGGFVCRSRRSGLRCTNRSGRGFVLTRARSYAF